MGILDGLLYSSSPLTPASIQARVTAISYFHGRPFRMTSKPWKSWTKVMSFCTEGHRLVAVASHFLYFSYRILKVVQRVLDVLF